LGAAWVAGRTVPPRTLRGGRVIPTATGGHGTYPLTFQLRGADGDAVWQWQPADPLDHPDPLTPQQLAFHELTVSVEKPWGCLVRGPLAVVAGDADVDAVYLTIWTWGQVMSFAILDQRSTAGLFS